MYEHNALGYWLGLALCLTKVRSSRARCPATALIFQQFEYMLILFCRLEMFGIRRLLLSRKCPTVANNLQR